MSSMPLPSGVVPLLEQIAHLMQLNGENPFKTRAYQNGARTIQLKFDPIVESVQRELLAAGYYKGPVDGVIGRKTRQAVAAYQQAMWLVDSVHESTEAGPRLAFEEFREVIRQREEALAEAHAGDVVLFHACCHNPTGYDLSMAQWDQVIAVVQARRLTPFLDMAYQGFGHGIAEDGAVVGKFVAAGLQFFISTSFSKSFSLYGERVGALSVFCASADEASRVLSQLKIVIRTNYSNPPIHGGAVVAAVLGNPELRALWEKELGEMRVRIKAMRQKLVDGLKAAGVKQDMSFITRQIGMFSYSGLSKDQMVRLRNEFGVYGTDTGRMCVAALNSKNIDHVCASIAKVVQ